MKYLFQAVAYGRPIRLHLRGLVEREKIGSNFKGLHFDCPIVVSALGGRVVIFFFSPLLFLAEGLSWMTVLLGSLQAAPFLYRWLRMCMKGWAKSKPQLLRGGLGDGW